jgi:hypothetical protein
MHRGVSHVPVAARNYDRTSALADMYTEILERTIYTLRTFGSHIFHGKRFFNHVKADSLFGHAERRAVVAATRKSLCASLSSSCAAYASRVTIVASTRIKDVYGMRSIGKSDVDNILSEQSIS